MSDLPSADSAQPTRSHRKRRRRRSSSSSSLSRREDPHLDPAPQPNHPLDTAIEWLMLPLLLFAPFAYGSVEAWSQFIVYAMVAAIVGIFCAKLLVSPRLPLVRTWAYFPLVLYLAWVGIQMLPLPSGFVQVLSAGTVGLKKTLLSDLPGSQELLRRCSLTFYPEGTHHDLRVVLAAAGMFVVVVNTYRNPAQIRRLILTIVAAGATVALLALAQDMTHATHIFWRDRHGRGFATAGPFMTYSHYGQFMNLVIGAGLGMLLVEIHRNLPRSDDPVVSPRKPMFHRSRRLSWIIIALIVIEVITVFYSASRGAMLGLLVALGIGTAALSQTRGLEGRAWIAIPAALILCAAVLLFGPSSIFDRFITLEHMTSASDRVQILKDLTREWKQFPLTGTGLGTHEVIYPIYDHSKHLETATHAENEYAQALEETGIIGLVLIMMFVLLVWSHAARATRNSDPPIRLAGLGLGVGLLAVEIHSFSDFGQHLPPNAILAAITCGLLVTLSRQSHSQRSKRSSRNHSEDASESRRQSSHDDEMSSPVLTIGSRAVAMAFVAAVCLWQLPRAYGAWRAESHYYVASGMEEVLAGQHWEGSDIAYRDILQEAELACTYAPANVMYRYSWYQYRWHAITRVRDPETNEIYAAPNTYRFARHICNDLNQARLLCPTYSHNLLLAGEIEYTLLHDPIGADHIRTAASLARNDQAANGMAGRCDADEGKWDDAVAYFRRYLELSGSFRTVVEAFVIANHKPELAIELAHNDIGYLTYLANVLEDSAPNLSIKARDMAFQLLRKEAANPEAPPDLLINAANQFVAHDQYPAAIKAYNRALALQDNNPQWHLEVAKLMAHEENLRDAISHLRRCLRLDPKLTEARDLLGDLSVRYNNGGYPATAPATQPATRSTVSPQTQPSNSVNVSPESQPTPTSGRVQ